MKARGASKQLGGDNEAGGVAAVPPLAASDRCLPSFPPAWHVSQDWCTYAHAHLEGCRQNLEKPSSDERSRAAEERGGGGSWGGEEARKSKHLSVTLGATPLATEPSHPSQKPAEARQRSKATSHADERRRLGGGGEGARGGEGGRRRRHRSFSVIGFLFICTDQKKKKKRKR